MNWRKTILLITNLQNLLCYEQKSPRTSKVNEGRITNGNPNSWAANFPSKKMKVAILGNTGISISPINFLNLSLSSVICIASISTPIISTSYFSQTPFSSIQYINLKQFDLPLLGVQHQFVVLLKFQLKTELLKVLNTHYLTTTLSVIIVGIRIN